ncbi:DEAD/DEAH box helicase [Autumnicola musiva]|uniref:DEAD/DEAH box helicase n=1 Tax=Autumnicola musiva TaxID=3075589 RepID=A0ABU3D2I0_9FLAO|nr:DEAD/DEAH box helicase [Zunongwangia sp. F117]MDT0675699.1 DEAD/DEAH box helicase [Zunongwangia sp. F117]
MSFNALGLSEPLLKAISKKGHTKPSTIQEKAIPFILERRDVLASAQTGTGKTAGFTLPMLQILSEGETLGKRPVRALVLTPTRELAAQVLEDVRSYSTFLNLRSNVIFGGVSAAPQIRSLRNGVDILVATPGRLLDLHQQKALSLANIEILILDEADRMLDMGFLRDIKKILALMPEKRQNLLFSATFSKEIKKLANTFLNKPVLVEATPENTTAEKVDQKIYKTNKSKKTALITKLISDGDWEQVLVFTRTKHGANRLSQKLEKSGITSAAIHGNKSQASRTKSLDGFKKGKLRVLVATDIAARGLDIPLLPHVINYELPNVPEDYVHRIGRTGRAGASGEAISLVSVDENEHVRGIEKLLGETLEKEVLSGFEPTENLQEVLEKKAENKARHNRGSRKNKPKSKGGFNKRRN